MKLLLINDDGETIVSANMAKSELVVNEEDSDWFIKRELNRPLPPPIYILSVSGTLVSDSENKLMTFYPDNNQGDVILNTGDRY